MLGRRSDIIDYAPIPYQDAAKQDVSDNPSKQPKVNPAIYDDYIRYLQAFRKASVSNERIFPDCNLTAFSALEYESTKHADELRRDAPRPNVYDLWGSSWFQSLVSMNLILTQAGAKFYKEIKQDDDTEERCQQTN